MATVTATTGDLFAQGGVDAIVNAWNPNLVAAARFTVSGVSDVILGAAGREPLRGVRRAGVPPVGDDVVTGPVQIRLRKIADVVGITFCHHASVDAVRDRRPVAFPVLGAGNGGRDVELTVSAVLEVLDTGAFDRTRRIVYVEPGW